MDTELGAEGGRQGWCPRGLAPIGVPAAGVGRITHLITDWGCRLDPAARSLPLHQARDPAQEAPPQPPPICCHERALPEQRVLRHKKAVRGLGAPTPQRLQKARARGAGRGRGALSTCHQEPEAGTPSPQGEQGENRI